MTPEHDPRPPRRPVLRSLLPRSLKWLLGLGLVLAAFMLANTLYLLLNRLADALGLEVFAVGETSLPALFQAMVLTHTGVGLLLVVVMLVFFLAHLRTGSSYLAQSETNPLLFGLGEAAAADSVRVRWPTDGATERFGPLESGRTHALRKGAGRGSGVVAPEDGG